MPTPKAFSLLFALQAFRRQRAHLARADRRLGIQARNRWSSASSRAASSWNTSRPSPQDMVARIKHGDIPDTAFATVDAPCPKCGGVVQENYRKFQCQSCDFSLWKVVSGREWSPEEVEELIRNRRIGPLTGFRSRQGRPFAASIRLNRRAARRIRFRPVEHGRGRGDQTGLQHAGIARRLPEMRCGRLRARQRLHLRARGRARAQLRFPRGAHHSATADRARTAAKAAERRTHRPVAALHLEEGAAVQGLSGEEPGWRHRLRVPASQPQGTQPQT